MRTMKILSGLMVAVIAVVGTAHAGDDDFIFGDGFDPAPELACGWTTAPGIPGALGSGGDPSSLDSLYEWQGRLYVGFSAFDTFNGIAGGFASMNLADNSTAPLGDAEIVDGFPTAFVPYAIDGGGERLYILGAFNGVSVGGAELDNSRAIVSWDGKTVSAIAGSPLQPLDFLWSGQVFQGRLALGGSSGAFDPPQKPLLALWDGTNWQTWSDEFEGPVAPVILTTAVFQDKLYVAGRFSGINQPDGAGGDEFVASMNILAFDGTTFSTVAGGVKRSGSSVSQVLALATFDDGTGEALYIGGRFDQSSDGTPLFAVARWDGTTLSAVGPGFPMPSEVRGLAVYDDGAGQALYATGTFTADVDGQPVTRFARWNGVTWDEVGGGTLDNPGPMVSLQKGGLAVGGSFDVVGDGVVAGSGDAHGLALWTRDCTSAAR